ncbi:MAG: prepilin-type N-terminal cleavage/methylation domain-containing protein [Candidatus Hydrogenedentes bacterium]|nr:prepilin-type N-terminal cleavage/methylation domain-containing protein [Candidatus Hydrogenedentota bacterium]
MRPIGQGRNEGFTLVELVAVVAIVALLAGVVVPTIIKYRSRRSKDLDNAALILRATLRAARTYAIQHRVRAAVVFRGTRRYYVVYEGENVWGEPLGAAGRDRTLPQNLSFALDSTVVPVNLVDARPRGQSAHIFDPTGTLDSPSALKATITVFDSLNGVSPDQDEIERLREEDRAIDIEILRATGRVRIR